MIDLSLKDRGTRSEDQDREIGKLIAVLVPVMTVILFLLERSL